MRAVVEALLLALLNKVRWLTLEQITRLLEVESLVSVRRLVAELLEARLVRREDVFLPRTELLWAPFFRWQPGEPAPAFGVVAHRMAGRWGGPCEAKSIVLATPRAARLFGGHAGRVQQAGRAHDLHLAEVYLQFLRTRPEEAMDWVSEAALAADREGQVLPDAAIVDRDGTLRLSVELVGHYPKERLARFHADAVARDLPYELW